MRQFSRTTKRLFNSFALKPVENAKIPYPQPDASAFLSRARGVVFPSSDATDAAKQFKKMTERLDAKDPAQNVILQTLNSLEKTPKGKFPEKLDLSIVDFATTVALAPAHSLVLLADLAKSRNVPNFASTMIRIIVDRDDVPADVLHAFALKYPEAFNRETFEALISSLVDVKRERGNWKELKTQGITFRKYHEQMDMEDQTRLLNVYKQIVGDIPEDAEKLNEEIRRIAQKNLLEVSDEFLEKPQPSNEFPFTLSGKTLVQLVQALKDHPKEGALIFHRHFYSLPNYEKRYAGPQLWNNAMKYAGRTNRDIARKLFQRFMDESVRDTDRYIAPNEDVLRHIAPFFSGLPRTVFFWKYAHLLTENNHLDSLDIAQREYAYKGQLDRVFELTNELFAPGRIHHIGKELEKEHEEAEKVRKAQAREEKEQRRQERLSKKSEKKDEGEEEEEAEE